MRRSGRTTRGIQQAMRTAAEQRATVLWVGVGRQLDGEYRRILGEAMQDHSRLAGGVFHRHPPLVTVRWPGGGQLIVCADPSYRGSNRLRGYDIGFVCLDHYLEERGGFDAYPWWNGLLLRSRPHGSDGPVAEACPEGGVEPGRDGRLRLLGLDLDRVLPTPEVLAGPHPGRQRMTREPPDCPICARKAAPEHCEWSQESREIVTSSAFGSRKEIVAVAVCAFRCWMCGTRGLEHVETE